jgi:hypothetical protein
MRREAKQIGQGIGRRADKGRAGRKKGLASLSFSLSGAGGHASGALFPIGRAAQRKGDACLDIHSIPFAPYAWYVYAVPVCLFSICQLIRAIELAWWRAVCTCPSCLRALAARHACITGGNSTSTLTTTLSPWSTCLYREEKTMSYIL